MHRRRMPEEGEKNGVVPVLFRSVRKVTAEVFRPLGRRLNAYPFEVERFEVEVPGLPPAFGGYKIVQVSDIHYGQWISTGRLRQAIYLVNQQKPDLVAITGDFVSYPPVENVDDVVPPLREIRARDGTVAVLGNHDHWVSAKKVRSLLNQSGIRELNNDVCTVLRNGRALHIAGVDCITVEKNCLSAVLQKLPKEGPAVLLAHEPDFADTSAGTERFCLQLSGHSHGGQIVLPKIGVLVRAPDAKRYPLGKYQVGEMIQYTNRGIGTNLFWMRINCPPEITVITLQPKKTAPS